MFDIIKGIIDLPTDFFLSDFILSIVTTCLFLFVTVLFFSMFYRILVSIFN